jgi:predicted N-acyltransferase
VRYQVARRIETFEEARWDAVAGREIVLSHRFQRVMEASRRDYRPLYLLIEDGLGPLAAVVAERTDRFWRPDSGWRNDLLRRLILRVGPHFAAHQSGIALRQGVALGDILPDLEGVLDAACRHEGRLLLSMANVSADELPAWRAQGYAAMPRPPTMVIDLPVDSYEVYLKGLPNKDQAKLRRFRRRGEKMGVTFSLGSTGEDARQLHAMLSEVSARHGQTADKMPFTEALFPALEREMGDEAMLLRGYVKGQLAGFLLLLKRGELLNWPVTGLRYELAHPSYLYFQLIEEAVRSAIAHGCRRFYGGTTNEQEKARHGFRPQARWFCFRLSPRPINRLLTVAAGLGRRRKIQEPAAAGGGRLGNSHPAQPSP